MHFCAEVFKLLQGHGTSARGTRHLTFLGFRICNKSFMKMIGVGKHRFFNIRSAATPGLERFPTDQRFLPREGRPQSVKRQAVYDFLHGLYEQSAETLPDQHTSHSNKRPRQGPYKYDDPTLSRSEVRHLPPGKFMDYLRLCRLENPDFTISRQLFSSARAPKSLD